MGSRALRGSMAAIVVAVVAYWYWSPFLTIHAMRTAARQHDADAFNEHVDYARLRESLKGQFSDMLARKMADSTSGGSDLDRLGGALGSVLGMALVDRFVDALVRPEMVMQAMAQARVKPGDLFGDNASTAQPSDRKVEWSYDRKSVDKLIAYGKHAGDPDDRRVGLVLERSGFANWKLTEIRLPKLDR